jgi:hypothetical protein
VPLAAAKASTSRAITLGAALGAVLGSVLIFLLVLAVARRRKGLVKLRQKATRHKRLRTAWKPKSEDEQWTIDEPVAAEEDGGLNTRTTDAPMNSQAGALFAQSRGAASSGTATLACRDARKPTTQTSQGFVVPQAAQTRSRVSSHLTDTSRLSDMPDLRSADACPPTASVRFPRSVSPPTFCSRIDGQRHISFFSSAVNSSVSPYTLVPPLLPRFPSLLQPDRVVFKPEKMLSLD